MAWHLQGFKASPLMVTSVGKDADGTEILEKMVSWGMDTSGVQTHPIRPTGRVTARIHRGEPHYDIEARQAYDSLSRGDLPPPPALREVGLLYHGSLAIREGMSAEALLSLQETLKVPTLLDVNLRDPWWSLEEFTPYLQGIDWVKVNREEAGLLAQLPTDGPEQLSFAAAALRESNRIGTLVVTLGPDGAMAVGAQGVFHQEAPAVSTLVDPVGAGDAFSAVLALGIHFEWPLETTLQRATEFAAELCRFRGATSENSEL
ncbi:MAG: PfkB family carbohydrate kinase, partial [Longimicrobiales bacterium]|nr:PfkB family carbohydrate kinase [Longimicrobiales bacterium]